MRALKAPKPLRQGELDALCGLYAVVNAIRFLCPELDDEASRQLFRALYGTAENFAQRVSFAHDGLGFDDLVRLLTDAQELLSSTRAVTLAVKTLPLSGPPSLPKLWAGMRAELSDGAALILGLSGLDDHWSVAPPRHPRGAAAARLLRSQDPAPSPVQPAQDRGTVRFGLEPSEILVLRRSPPGASLW